LGESLLRYESLGGFPVDMRERVFDYLARDLRLLYPQHLEVLLDDEFVALDFTALERPGKVNKTNDAYLKLVGDRCPHSVPVFPFRFFLLLNVPDWAACNQSGRRCSVLEIVRISGCTSVHGYGLINLARMAKQLKVHKAHFASSERCAG
jgi:hypothetical protein